MTPGDPYVIRAVIDWICDNACTPYVVANTKEKGCLIPDGFAVEDLITFNVSARATRDLSVDQGGLSFNARFAGVSQEVIVPINAIHMIYAQENGAGIVLKSPGIFSFIPSEQSEDKVNLRRNEFKRPNLTIVE